MTGVGPLISSLISSVTNLLPKVRSSFFTPSSSSSAQSPNPRAVEEDLHKLMRMLERIKAILYDAEDREIRDRSVKLWLKELKEVAHDAEHVIDEYMYEVYRAQVETRNASELNPHKRNKEEASGKAACDHFIRVPEKFVDSIRDIRSKFDEITKDRVALCLRPEDGPRRDEGVQFRAPSSHLLWESNVFGRKRDKEKVINLLFPNINEGIVGVISIVGKGGLGKTTLAQLVFNDKRVKQNFHLFGWTCVSEDFIVERLLQDLIESFTGNGCYLKTASALHDKIKNIMEGKRVIIVLDDVWNEDKNFWESFYVPFKSALSVVFIVTTRSDRVAQVMETTSLYQLEYLSEEESWSLFQHYAFFGTDNSVDPNMLNIGRQITKKCGGLPLAVKSISNLLRFEGSITALSSLYHLGRLKLNRFHNLIKLEALRDLVNLQSLSLSFCKTVPESLGLLCSLRILCIKDCTTNGSLEIIGNLIQLEYLLIHGCKGFLSPESLCKLSRLKTLSLTECPEIVKLPNNVGNLTNLQNLLIWDTGINFVPPSFTKLNILSLKVQMSLRLDGVSDTISWLKDFDDLKGSLSLRNLRFMHSLEDACKFNLRSKPYIEKLILSWRGDKWFCDEKDMLQIEIETSEDYMKKTESTRDLFGCDMDLKVLENLRPHPNLKQMEISDYKSYSFPTWMGDPLCCASLQEILLGNCCQISYLPFHNLSSLTHLRIYGCSAMQKISREFIPSQLQNLIISNCNALLTVMGLEGLESLVFLTIHICARLASFPFELISEGRCHKSSSGLKNLSPVKKVFLDDCPELQLAVNEVIPSVHCDIEITECEGLKEWCLQHNISYTNHTDFSEGYSSSDDLEEDTADGSEDGDDDNEEEGIVENSEDGNSDDSQEEDSEDGDLGDKEEENILENIEDEKLDDNKGKQIMENNEVRSPTSQRRQIPTGDKSIFLSRDKILFDIYPIMKFINCIYFFEV
ncbi:hypothetical protein LUZ60_002429 [Juncus effusus]|nr:hypothetical protein LUZ60_002429 [Juncus effusus]